MNFPNLKIENFSITITATQVTAIIKHAVEAQNPGYTVESVKFNISKGYEGGYGQSDVPPGLTNVEVTLKKKKDF